MSKTSSTALRNIFAASTNTLRTLAKLTLKDGTVLGFTDHDSHLPVVCENETF